LTGRSRAIRRRHPIDDDPPQILSADDACPICNVAMTDRGRYVGTWDGALGQGYGNWYIAKCRNCGAELIGWEYAIDSPTGGDPVVHVRWDGRRDQAAGDKS
jgi:hypothetical protein